VARPRDGTAFAIEVTPPRSGSSSRRRMRLTVKLGFIDMMEGGLGLNESIRRAKLLDAAGADAFEVSCNLMTSYGRQTSSPTSLSTTRRGLGGPAAAAPLAHAQLRRPITAGSRRAPPPLRFQVPLVPRRGHPLSVDHGRHCHQWVTRDFVALRPAVHSRARPGPSHRAWATRHGWLHVMQHMHHALGSPSAPVLAGPKKSAHAACLVSAPPGGFRRGIGFRPETEGHSGKRRLSPPASPSGQSVSRPWDDARRCAASDRHDGGEPKCHMR